MNQREFDSWFRYFAECFPDTGEWAKRNAVTLPIWREVLADVEFDDAKSATRAIVRGDEPPIAAYERENTPGRIRAYAQKLAGERTAREANRRTLNQGHRRYSPTVLGESLGAYLAAVEARKRGESAEAVKQIIAKALGEMPEQTYRDAFKCPACKDVGVRLIWGKKAVDEAKAGRFDKERPEKYNTARAACDRCPAGNKLAEYKSKRSGERVFTKFDPVHNCGFYGTDQQHVADFLEWIATTQKPAFTGNLF